MSLTALFARAPGDPPPALPRLGPDEAEPVPGCIGFAEFLAALNPLHHLPVVGTIYRAATGERLPPAMGVLGGALLGGPLGMLSSAVMAAIEEFRPGPPPSGNASALQQAPHGRG